MNDGKKWNSPEQLAGWVRAQASRPDAILAVSILCEPRSPGRAACLADVVADYAPQLATELRGQTFGYGTVVVTMDVGADFSCSARPNIPCNCSCRPVAA